MCTRIGTTEVKAGIVTLFKYNAKNKDLLAPFFTNFQGLIKLTAGTFLNESMQHCEIVCRQSAKIVQTYCFLTREL